MHIHIPVGAEVRCTDGPCGQCTYAILNPITEEVTHLAVKERHFPHTERLVPIDVVMETTSQLIRLGCTEGELAKYEPFVETDFVEAEIPHYRYAGVPSVMWPYATPEKTWVPVTHKSIPPHEIAVRRGAQVVAIDGQVGRVDEFLVNPQNGHITHLVLREGHLWGQRDVTIPVSEIEHIEENAVYLTLDKRGVEALPVIPVQRWWS